MQHTSCSLIHELVRYVVMNRSKRVHQSKELWVTNSIFTIEVDWQLIVSLKETSFQILFCLTSGWRSSAFRARGHCRGRGHDPWALWGHPPAVEGWRSADVFHQITRVSTQWFSSIVSALSWDRPRFFTSYSVGPSRVTTGAVHHNNMFDIQNMSNSI